MKKVKIFDTEIKKMLIAKVEEVLEKPRVSAYTPQALVEIVYTILSMGFDQKKFEKRMFMEYVSKSRPWWLMEDLDYVTATNRLKKLVDSLREEI